MTTSYKIFFSVDIMHDYYAQGKSRDFEILPTEQTARLLKGQNMLVKMVGNKLVVLVKVKGREVPADEGKPFIDVDKKQVFSFYMQLNSGSFMNFTNLDFDPSVQKRFYFSNHSNNEHDNKLYLSKKIPAYGNGSYLPGNMAEGALGLIYETLKETTGNAHDTLDPIYWIEKGKTQYATPADLAEIINSIYNITTAPAFIFSIDVLAINFDTGVYDRNVLHQDLVFTETQTSIQLNLNGFTSGLYIITVNGISKTVYLDDNMVYNNAFGVLDIFHHLPVADKFSMLDVDGKILEKNFLVKFANKQAYWKYYTPKHQVKAITDISGKYKFLQTPSLPEPQPPPPANFFISDLPIPLKETPQQFTMDIPDISGDEQPPAPNPDPANNQSMTKSGNDFYYNIHLNY